MEDKFYENLGLIVAIGESNEIGCKNNLIWRIKEDLDYFKNVTMNTHIIMGRNTYESMPKNLKGRKYIVLSKDKTFNLESPKIVTRSISETLELVCQSPESNYWVIGGGAIYREFIPFVSSMHITEIMSACPNADTYFPEYPKEEWLREEGKIMEEDTVKYRHVLLKRMNPQNQQRP